MSDVFISYKREDGPRVALIADGLREHGLSVWMDIETPGGASWRQTIVEKLEAAACVLVVWSESSVSPAGDFVHDEAARAKDLGVLVPVRIDPVSPPLGFGEIQTLDLVGWRGNEHDPHFLDVVASVKAQIAGGPRPRPKAPDRRKRLAAAVASGGTVLAAVVGFLGDIAGLQGAVCRVPGVRAVCGAVGFGGVPTQAEEKLWVSRPAGECQPLRAYLDRFAEGAYAEEAQRRLQAARTERQERWTPEERRLPMTLRQGLDPFEEESKAREDALARGHAEAPGVCSGYEVGEFRLLSAAAEAQTWRCASRPGGIVCGFDGQAVCQVETRYVDSIEVCL